MKTQICEQLGIEFPLFAFTHCRDVAAAVSRAGGFGVFGGAMMGADQLKIELDWIDEHVDGNPYGVDLAIPENMPTKDEQEQNSATLYARVPNEHKVFVNSLLERHGVNPDTPVAFDEPHQLSPFLDEAERMVDESLRHPIKLLVNALGLPPAFLIERAHSKNVAVGALVGSKDHAVRQIEAGVDVLIAQGTEAAAHCGEVSTMVLTPEVVRAVKDIKDVPVLAAGGIVTGAQMAAAMAMGAAGAWTGSVWLTTAESNVAPVVREKILAAKSRDTIRSRAMTGKTARQLRTAWSAAWESEESPGALPMPFQHLLTDRAFQQATKSYENGNEQAREIVSEGVGQGIGMIVQEKDCRTVVREFMEEFAESIERLNELVVE